MHFRCPFCGAYAYAESPAPGEPGEPHVLHALPICKQFERLDAIEYMRAVNEAIEQTRKP